MDKKKLVAGLALFSMFFGAGNLIFPPTLGQLAGQQFVWAMLGFNLTGVGLVMLAVFATAKAGGRIEDLSKTIGKPFGLLFGTLVLLSIGPGLALPRTAATTFEVIEVGISSSANNALILLGFFIVVLLFSLKPSAVIGLLGKVLTPVLVILLVILIGKSIVSPMGEIVANAPSIFSESIIEGYQTMDALAALAFTALLIQDAKFGGLESKKEQQNHLAVAGVIASVLMGIIYFGLIFMGAQASGDNFQGLTRVQLLVKSSEALLGSAGKIVMVVSLALACLTTAIGLTCAVSEFFDKLSKGKLKYPILVILCTIMSYLIALLGVEKIVVLSVPVLTLLYPISIVLVIINLIGQERVPRIVQILAVVGSVVGLYLPFLNPTYGWIFTALIGAVIGYVCSFKTTSQVAK